MAHKEKKGKKPDTTFLKEFAKIVNNSAIVKKEEKPKEEKQWAATREAEFWAQRKKPGPAPKEPEPSVEKADSSQEGLARAALRNADIRANKQAIGIAVELLKEGEPVSLQNVELKKAMMVINPESSRLAAEQVRWLIRASTPWEYFTSEMNSPNLPGNKERLELLVDCLPERTALFLAKFAAAPLYSEGLERFLRKPEGREFVYGLISRLRREGDSLDAKRRLSEAQKRAFVNAGAEFITGEGEKSVVEFMAELRKLGEKLKA
jgi:hypothetical protein